MSPGQSSVNPTELTRDDEIKQILLSVAMEDLWLSELFDAESEKLRFVLDTFEGVSGLNPSVDDLLSLTDSVQNLLDDAIQYQISSYNKIKRVLNTSSK